MRIIVADNPDDHLAHYNLAERLYSLGRPKPTEIGSPSRASKTIAISLDKAKGDITGSDAILWTVKNDTPWQRNLSKGRKIPVLCCQKLTSGVRGINCDKIV